MSNNRVTPGPIGGNCGMPREVVCISTKKVCDSCKDKECLQDLRVYLTASSQCILDNAIGVKAKSAEILWANIDVEPISFNKGFYTVDVRYFYKITAEASCGIGRSKEITGIAVYDKKTVLFGSEGSARIFNSQYSFGQNGSTIGKNNVPTAVIEAVDPVCLSAKIVDACNCCGDNTLCDLPDCVAEIFDDEILSSCENKVLYVSLGQFSIIRLERDTQLLIPAYDICFPQKECSGNSDDPCDIFEKFKFPVDEFFPPKQSDMIKVTENKKSRFGC